MRIQDLNNPNSFQHELKKFEIIETHISYVVLTGKFVYKIKKPICFSFVDFTTIEKRKYYCEQELKLNQALASSLYISVEPLYKLSNNHITFIKPSDSPYEIIDYAIKEHQFEQDKLWSNLITQNKISSIQIENIAKNIAKFHLAAEKTDNTTFGSYELNKELALENFDEIKEIIFNSDYNLQNIFNEILYWTKDELKIQKSNMVSRKKNNFIRGVHGDLHLGNITIYNNESIIFDCIEFNDSFRFIDIINDMAFLTMDLKKNNQELLAYIFYNYYFNLTQDFSGLKLVKFYEIYRAMVRAKVELCNNNLTSMQHYLKLSNNLIAKNKICIYLMHGFSGSGKTHFSQNISPYLKAIRISSDQERKNIYQKLNNINIPMYSDEINNQTYTNLLKYTQIISESMYSVIIDASFLDYAMRTKFLTWGAENNLPIKIIVCEADKKTMEYRIQNRLKNKSDYSDATIEILNQQIKNHKELNQKEQEKAIHIDTNDELNINKILKLII